MRTRIVVALFVAWAALSLAGAPAAMASYGADGGLTVVPTSPARGDKITVDSSGWKSGSVVRITLHSTPMLLASKAADTTGGVHAQVAIPPTAAPGAHTLQLTGVAPSGAARTVSAAITVDSGNGSLPRTGAAIAALLVVGSMLFGIGSLLSTARKRAVR
jgi:LPXTG-motif cell wall-anchored protein